MKILIRLFLSVFLIIAGAVAMSERSTGSEAFAQSDNQVTITNFKFEPRKMTVSEGTTVTWVNQEGNHTVTEDNGVFVSRTLKGGDNFTYQFNKAGTYPYHCALHGSKGGGEMSGTIVVVKKK